jgi:hypothetical protein
MPGPGFPKGHPKYAGRTQGAMNKLSIVVIRRVVAEAASKVGYDGQGRDGLRGWLQMMCEKHPLDYLNLIGRMIAAPLPSETQQQLDDCEYETVDEVERALIDDGLRVTYNEFTGRGPTSNN